MLAEDGAQRLGHGEGASREYEAADAANRQTSGSDLRKNSVDQRSFHHRPEYTIQRSMPDRAPAACARAAFPHGLRRPPQSLSLVSFGDFTHLP